MRTLSKWQEIGVSHEPWYRSWIDMMDRCKRPKNNRFRTYGARGITVCTRWESCLNFFADMGPRLEGMTLERINNNLGYSPDNCRWASKADQVRNRTPSSTWKRIKNPRRFSPELIEEIKNKYKKGNITQAKLAEEYKVNRRVISALINDKHYKGDIQCLQPA